MAHNRNGRTSNSSSGQASRPPAPRQQTVAGPPFTRDNLRPTGIDLTTPNPTFQFETPSGGPQGKRSKVSSNGRPKSPKRTESATTTTAIASLRPEEVDKLNLQDLHDILIQNNFEVQRANELRKEYEDLVKSYICRRQNAGKSTLLRHRSIQGDQ